MKQVGTGKSIAFTGGGTGGHIQPIVSLIEYAKNHSELGVECKDLYWFGEKGGQEEKACVGCLGVHFIPVISGKVRRDLSLSSICKNIGDMFRVVYGVLHCCFLLKKYQIHKVFCKGGYVALPVCMAAGLLRIPIIVHESDMHAGLVNRLVARIAKYTCVGFPGTFPSEIVTGQILSDQLLTFTPIQKQTKTQVLVMGGSQGAATLFDVIQRLCNGGDCDVTFHVLLGTQNQGYKTTFAGYTQVVSYDFLDQRSLAALYAHCDVAITRGSATSLAEQELFGIKKIIVPLPRTGGNHQFHNALQFVSQSDDILVEQDELLFESIRTFLQKLTSYKKPFTAIDQEILSGAKKTIRSLLLE